MPLKRSRYQSKETLEEFYERKEWKGGFAIISANMLKLVARINELFPETQLTASTSHQRLCIQDQDDEDLNWVVIISNHATDEYHFEYKVPKNKSPWENAWMKGTANDLAEAAIYLIKSMDESEAWKENEELIGLKKNLT